MASASEIAEVRDNTGEPTSANFDDSVINALVDASGVERASEIIWLKKAARLADLVNMSEAGASRSYGDLSRNALAMAKEFATRADKKLDPVTGTRATTVGRIVR